MIGKYSTQKIAMQLVTLQPEEFIGVMKILGVKLVTEGGDPKDFTEMWQDAIDAISGMSRRKRKNLMQLLRAANEGRKIGGGNNAADSED